MWWAEGSREEGVRQQKLGELLRKIAPLFRPHLRLLTLSTLLMLVITASQLAGPKILQFIIDEVIDAGGRYSGQVSTLLTAAALYVGITLAGAAVGYLQAISLFRLGIAIITTLKARLFEHVLRLGLEFHAKHPPGVLISRVENDTETLKELFGNISVDVLRNLMLFLGILAMMLFEDWRLGIWVVLMMPLLFGMTFVFVRLIKPLWREVRAQVANILRYVSEYVQGVEVIQQFNYQGRARERMAQVNQKKYRVQAAAMFIDYTYWGVFMFTEIAAIVIVLVIGVPRVFEGTLTVGTLFLFVEFIRRMYWPIMQLSEQINFIQRSFVSVERVFGILETPPSIVDGTAPASELSFEREIRFENVWFSYDIAEGKDNPHWILRDVSFSLAKGENIALVGSSGGGKSTIVNLLLRFYDPQKGRITVDGRDIRDFPVTAWRKLIGLVLQDIFLFPGTVADNLRVFSSSVDIKRVEEAARIAHADVVIEKLPGGMEGQLAERGENLSVGERQLISFARALSFNPPLLVLDEATSSVDPYTERLVQEALERLLAGRTAVIVAHRLSTILGADKILLIHEGHIAEQGDHVSLVEQDGLYTKLVRLQFGDAAVEAMLAGGESAGELALEARRSGGGK